VVDGQSIVQDLPSPSLAIASVPSTPYVLSLGTINESATPIPYASPLGPFTPATEESGTLNRLPRSTSRPQASAPTVRTGQPSGDDQALPQNYSERRRRSLTPNAFSPVSPPRSPKLSHLAHSQAFTTPGSELLLWAYARLVGTLEIDDEIVSPSDIEALRAQLRAGGFVGGGRMDIDERGPSSAAGSPSLLGAGSSILSSLFGGGPSSNVMSSAPQTSASPSYLASLFGTGMPSGPSFPGGTRSRSMSQSGRFGGVASPFFGGMFGGSSTNDDPLSFPTLETQPSVLAVDLKLAPGESRSCESNTAPLCSLLVDR
jgi:hypothetical protein